MQMSKFILVLICSCCIINSALSQSELKSIRVGKGKHENSSSSPTNRTIATTRITNAQIKEYKAILGELGEESMKVKFRPPCQLEKLSNKEVVLSKEYKKVIEIPDSLLFLSASFYLKDPQDSMEEVRVTDDTLDASLIQKLHNAKEGYLLSVKFRQPSIVNKTIYSYLLPGIIIKSGVVQSSEFYLNLLEKDAFAKHPNLKGATIVKTYVKAIGGKSDQKEFTYHKAKIDRNELPCDVQYFIFEFDLIKQGKKYSRNFMIKGKF